MTATSLLLMNCRHCDDVVKLVERERACECGIARGKVTDTGEVTVTGNVRVFAITWEAYDGIEEGESRPLSVLPRARYRGRGA